MMPRKRRSHKMPLAFIHFHSSVIENRTKTVADNLFKPFSLYCCVRFHLNCIPMYGKSSFFVRFRWLTNFYWKGSYFHIVSTKSENNNNVMVADFMLYVYHHQEFFPVKPVLVFLMLIDDDVYLRCTINARAIIISTADSAVT